MRADESRRYKRPESVLVVVHTKTGFVLQLERADVEGFWQSVTGSLEPGESPRAAAHRELFEETGLDSETAGVRLRDHHTAVRFEIREPWRARYAPGVTENLEHRFSLVLPERRAIRLSPDEHRRCRWVTPECALSLASSRTDRLAIESLVASGRLAGRSG